MRKISDFGRIFLYTLAFMIMAVSVIVVLLAGQFSLIYRHSQSKMLSESISPFIVETKGKEAAEIKAMAEELRKNNPGIAISIETYVGEPIFTMPEADLSPTEKHSVFFLQNPDIRVRAISIAPESTAYREMFPKIAPAIAGLIILSLIGALLLLSTYGKLRRTINQLETEIEVEKKMEENQRYFFSAASHELKTPIAAMAALLEGMAANVGDYKNHPKYLKECINLTKSQNKIVSEILEIVSLTEGAVDICLQQINLKDLIEAIVPEYKTLSEKLGQSFYCHIPEGLVVTADRRMLSRALSNIIMNAVQNTPKQGEISIWTYEAGQETELFIKNTNAHIPEDLKLFEPFTRADKARSRESGGSGLGLSIVKKMLDSMDIPFELKNHGDGVLFCMRLNANS